MKKRFITQKPEKSLRAFLKEAFSQESDDSEGIKLSGKAIKALIDEGRCLVDGKLEKFGSKALKPGATIDLHLPEDFLEKASVSGKGNHQIKKAKSAFDPSFILYEDDDLLIYNKPCGLVCSPRSIISFFPKRLYLVHRLDKATSGALILAKTKKMQEALEDLFRNRLVEKVYHALVQGDVAKSQGKKEGTIKSFLIKKGSFDGQTLYGSCKKGSEKEGKEAITHWKVLSQKEGSTLVECTPKTGRTHQLRVHMQELGHPILGDTIYARKAGFFPRMMLHATQVRFKHPETGKSIEAKAPVGFNCL